MRQHLTEPLEWIVLALALASVGFMTVQFTRGWVPWHGSDVPPAQGVTIAPAPAPSSTPPAAPSHKPTRALIAQQKKAAAISAKPTRFETERADDVAMAGGGIPALLIAAAIIVSPFWLFVIWRRWLRRRRAMIQGEGFEEGRMRARARAGLI